MKLSDIVIVLLLMSGLVVGTYSLINDLASEETGYNITVDQQYLETFNKTTQLSNNISASYEELVALPSYSSSNFYIISLVPEALSLMKDFLTLPFVTANSMIQGVTAHLGLPMWINSTFLAIMCVVLIFAFVTLILRFTS
jgi:hypothetical protein